MKIPEDNTLNMPRWKRILFNLLALLIGLLFFWGIGELGIRIIYPKGIPEVYPAMFQNDAVMGYKLKTNYTGVHRHRDFIMTYTINSSGFRDYDHAIKKSDGVYRILVLGDSMTFGVGAPMEETYPKVLEKMLNSGESTKQQYEVMNTGVPGYNTDQEYNFYTHEGVHYEPDMVIVGFFGMNDVDGVETGWQNFSAPNGYLVQRGKEDSQSARKAIKEWVLSHSKLALIVNYKLMKLVDAFKRHGKSREIPYQIYQDNYSKSFTQAIKKTEQYLMDMNRIAQTKHSQFVLLLIPFEMEVNKKNWLKYQLEDAYSEQVFNKEMLKDSKLFSQFGKDNHIPTLDLVTIFRADHPESCYFTWEAHLNSTGHKLVAESLYSYITGNQLIVR